MSEYKQFAMDIARQAGAIIKENFSFGMSHSIKSDNTPVTDTDLKVNELLLKGVREKFPGHNVLAEEESDMSHESEYVWVCDPIDGTIPFSHGIPTSTFSLALVKNGESILGVVYDPYQDHLFVAEKGGGAYLNDKQINVSSLNTFRGAVANCEFYNTAIFDTTQFAINMQMLQGVQTMRLASFVLSGVLVAVGELAFAVFPGKFATMLLLSKL